MHEILKEIEAWRKSGSPVAIATNVKKDGSSLRPLGAKMALTPGQKIAGSVTGGCIEGAVYEEAQSVMKDGQPKLLHYKALDDGSPWDIGLSCGGSLDVFIETLDSPAWQEIYPVLKTSLARKELVAVVTIISGIGTGKKMMLWQDGRALGSLGDSAQKTDILSWAQGQMRAQEPDWKQFTDMEVFVDVLPPPKRMIVIGAVHVAIPLVTLAKALGYYTIVIDPRSAFATQERFPHVDELIIEWPSDALEKLRLDEGTYIAALSHDEKLDNPALAVALASPARYVGVLGAKKNISRRLAALKELGATEPQLLRLHAPIGVNLSAILPEEIALSILAEMVIARYGV